ncbi:transposase [Nonomuraea sp. M3C6]|uniref:Transposase n=1 Tax=Nonomuraea marmarensis TaxID=3351344 RepID=A0ABW7AV67_9ACTN
MPGGFTLDDFVIDTGAGTVTCPAGHTVPLAAPSGRYQQRRATFTGLCTACPLHDRCTTAKTGRTLTIRPHHDLQTAVRHQAATDPAWQDDYRRWRPLVERAVAWLVARGNRRLPYRGTHANDRWLYRPAAALNLRRLVNLGLTHINNTWTLTATPRPKIASPVSTAGDGPRCPCTVWQIMAMPHCAPASSQISSA